MEINDLLLDDPEGLAVGDPAGMLAATAGAGGFMRAAAGTLDVDAVERLADDGRPRAVVVVGGGGSTAAGDILNAVAGLGSPIPVITSSGPSLPGWVGPTDLVVAVSGSGSTQETLASVSEAVRRGCRLAAICPAKSELAQIVGADRSAQLLALSQPADGRPLRARALLWSLATPLLLLGGRIGLVDDAPAAIARAADSLDDIARTCGPVVPIGENPAKQLALEVGQSWPVIWGTGDVGAVAAQRFSRQLAENAGLPSSCGAVPEAARTQSVLFAGPRAVHLDADDIFRDRVEDPEPQVRLRLVLLRDSPEHPETALLADRGARVAQDAAVPISIVRAEPGNSLDRLVALVGPTDFASVYAALALGIDPTPGARELGVTLDDR